MILLYLIGFVAGLVVGISPCILPVLPVILVASVAPPPSVAAIPDDEPSLAAGGAAVATAPAPKTKTATAAAVTKDQRWRAYAVIAGLLISFSAFTLAGSELLSALHLPQDFLRDAGLVILGAVAVGLLVPSLAQLLERPFARVARHQPTGNKGTFVLGLGLGVLFVPCAGPFLAAIAVASANHRVGLTSVVLTADFSAGVGVPLLAFALGSQRLAKRFRLHAAVARQIAGVVLLVMVAILAFNWTSGLQTHVPGYTSALQRNIEGTAYAKKQLAAVDGEAGGTLAHCTSLTTLVSCGEAPAFKGISTWLNTPDGRPVSLAGLQGKVVLVDFWTYSCINCQRSLPHVEAWYSRYHADGFDVVGVHTPEFAFEHVVSNIVSAAGQLGVHYPIAVDNDYETWDAYSNQYWPAEYLVDSAGDVRHVEFGEGDYGATENLIRRLLVAADPKVHLPSRTGVANTTPMNELTPETYLGYNYQLQNLANASITPDRPAAYRFPASVPLDDFALGGTWTAKAEDMVAGTGAQLQLSFQADDVYLVLGGSGTVDVSVDGKHTRTVTVSGPPRLYTLVHGAYRTSNLMLSASPGIEAYDFTFG